LAARTIGKGRGVEGIAGWLAPAATMIAAMMTAANLGARVTGWGFVVFTVGSICWSILGLSQGDAGRGLLISNAFLTVVNLVGIWRWLGRQARYEQGGKAATRRSATARVPTLFAVGGLAGATLTGRDGEKLGEVVEAMMRCDGAALAYLVVSEGGVGGVGERLHALSPAELRFTDDGVKSDLTRAALTALPVLEPDRWPAAI
jgi:hypothetical protein